MYKRIDTCAAEFASPTAYMYSTYETPVRRRARSRTKASRPTRRRSSSSAAARTASARASSSTIAAVTPAFALRDAGFETIMVNCNPETVSTDYDTSDRLYFEPLTAEDVLEIVRVEQSRGTLHGVIVQFGGQTPLKLAARWRSRVPILGTSPMRSTSPKTATASSSCSTSCACSSRRTASPIRSKRRARSPKISAFRSWSARPTCSAAAPWRSSARIATRRLICSAHLPELVPDVKRAIRTTRPARSTRCSARTRC